MHYCPNAASCPTNHRKDTAFYFERLSTLKDWEETVALLVENDLIENYADLYDDHRASHSAGTNGRKSAENLIKGIEASKSIPFERVLFGLGIRYVGRPWQKIGKTLYVHRCHTSGKFEDLISVDEIGDKIAESVIHFFLSSKQRVNDPTKGLWIAVGNL